MIQRFLLLLFVMLGLTGCYQGKIASSGFENFADQNNSKNKKILTRFASVATGVPFKVNIAEQDNVRLIGALIADDIMQHAKITGAKLGKLDGFFSLMNSQTNKEIKKTDIFKLKSTLGAINKKDGVAVGTINVTVEDLILSAKSKLEDLERKSKKPSKPLGDLEFTIITKDLNQSTIDALTAADPVGAGLVKEFAKDKDGNVKVVLGPLNLVFDSSVSKK